jgi:hypothetical protein
MDETATGLWTPHSPLEEFVRDYVEVTGGVWEEVEPQVYDVLLPAAEPAGGEEALRIAFDPEALPEHPGAQLASYGTPLIDHLLADAVARGRFARLYVIGLNLTPHDLAGRARRALTLPPDSRLGLEHVRLLHFPQAVFWFQATFVSDQKEQEILPIALDLHYGRQVRHLEQLLDRGHLSETPSVHLPEANRLSLAAAYPLARERVVPTVAALANTRAREAAEQVERQVARMRRYYADLRAELEEQVERAKSRGEDLARFSGRREALEREEHVRVAELRQKSSLRVQDASSPGAGRAAAEVVAAVGRAGGRPAAGPPGAGVGPADGVSGTGALPRVRPPDAGLGPDSPGPSALPHVRRRGGKGSPTVAAHPIQKSRI